MIAVGLAAFVGVWRWNGDHGSAGLENSGLMPGTTTEAGQSDLEQGGQISISQNSPGDLDGQSGERGGLDTDQWLSGNVSVGELPTSHDLREHVPSMIVPDQGTFGTCWAFAALKALETSIPENLEPAGTLSADHMSLKNSFGIGQDDGGNSSVASAYLLSWQGPVSEALDPYGDGISPDDAQPVYHVQEMQILGEKDFEAVKRAVYAVGGVQSSFYMPQSDKRDLGNYYNEETNAFFYRGENEVNHEIVIIGWDDGYSKENFVEKPDHDGAFLCMNTWGDEFGDSGYFYVSYEDSRIGENCVVYTGIESPENYDVIYQTDLCGWTGQLGYGDSKAWFANVYTAEADVTLEAAGFYATVPDTAYRIYVVKLDDTVEENGLESVSEAGLEADSGMVGKLGKRLSEGVLAAEGRVGNAGYYTVALAAGSEACSMTDGQRFAVVVEIDSPSAVEPVAIEYRSGSRTAKVDIADGEGYISSDGTSWERTETAYQCNVCLKVYANGG